MGNASSEHELLELLRDGKITEEEYEELLAAMKKSAVRDSGNAGKRGRRYIAGIFIGGIVVVAVVIMLVTAKGRGSKAVSVEEFHRDFVGKVAKLDIDTAKLEDVIAIFGEPVDYVWGREVIERDRIPVDRYCVRYPNDVQLFMRWDTIVELRFESPAAGYVFRDKIRVGSSLDEVIAALGEPVETVEGGAIGWVDGVLYKDVNGRKGYCYYHRGDERVRFFFMNYKVTAIYITRSDYNGG